MCRSIISLSKITPHRMWCNHSFSQRNKTAERPVGMGIGGDRQRGLEIIRGDRQYSGGGGGGLQIGRGD